MISTFRFASVCALIVLLARVAFAQTEQDKDAIIKQAQTGILMKLTPDQIRMKLVEMRFKLGPIEIPYRFVPGFYQWKLMQTYRRRHRELQQEERGVLETRYFRPSFIKAYEARLAGGKVDAPPDQEVRRKR